MRIDNDIEYREYIEQMLKAEEEINGYEMESEISGDGEETIEKKDYPYRVEDIRIDFKMLSVYQLYRWIQVHRKYSKLPPYGHSYQSVG